MRLTTEEESKHWRKPDNDKEEFEEGGFADFIRPLKLTLDLYHNRQVDLRSVTIAFNQLVQEHPEAELSVASFEVRGKNKNQLLLRVETAEDANHSELSTKYFNNYNYLKALSQNNLKALPPEALIHMIADKDNQIRILIDKAGVNINANNYYHFGDNMSQSPKKVSTYDLTNAQIAGSIVDADTVNAEQIGGTINNYPNVPDVQDITKKIRHELQTSPSETSELATVYLDVIDAEIVSSEQNTSKVKANLKALWELVKEITPVAEQVLEIATKLGLTALIGL